MRHKQWFAFALGAAAVLSLGAVTNQVQPLSSQPLTLGDLGVTFPDGSLQTTAATAGVEAVPCYCEQSAEKGVKVAVDCWRGDDDMAFTQIPAGSFFLLSDMTLSSPSGSFFVSVGKDDAAGSLTLAPTLAVRGLGGATDQTHRSFRAPYIVLAAGEALAIKNTGTSTGTVTIQASGFLVPEVTHSL